VVDEGPEDPMSTVTLLRVAVTVGLLVLLGAAEALWPRRERRLPRLARWPSNLGLIAVDQLAVRFLAPVVPVAFAARWEGGLLSAVAWPAWAEVVVAVVLLDLAIYAQHVLFHRVPWLWRLHRVHHADPDLDVTSALRFHPVEILLSVGIKVGVIALTGASPVAVVAFELILNGMAMFNHANLALPRPLDAALRTLVVTPDVHRTHHSVRSDEKHTNFGFNLVIWDRLFGTYLADARGGQLGMVVGDQPELRPEDVSLGGMLLAPLRAAAPSAGPPSSSDEDRAAA
jgi:sterol desaturase/sphingolipid hydroxylase (fatty acid hydroxylase superfamily)